MKSKSECWEVLVGMKASLDRKVANKVGESSRIAYEKLVGWGNALAQIENAESWKSGISSSKLAAEVEKMLSGVSDRGAPVVGSKFEWLENVRCFEEFLDLIEG